MRRAAAIAAAALVLGACGSDTDPTGERATDPGFVPATTTTTTLPADIADVAPGATVAHENVTVDGGITPEVFKVDLPGMNDPLTFCVGGIRYLVFEISGYTDGGTATGVADPGCEAPR